MIGLRLHAWGATLWRNGSRQDDPGDHNDGRQCAGDQAREGEMGSALVVIVAMAIILWFIHKHVQANPRGMAWLLRQGGGIALLIAATFLTVRGEWIIALPLAITAFGLLGWMPQLSLGHSDGAGAGGGEGAHRGADARQ